MYGAAPAGSPRYHETRMSSGTSRRPGRKAYLLISLFALALVLFPFLFWYYTWFGRKLSDSEIDQYFADTSKPRHEIGRAHV